LILRDQDVEVDIEQLSRLMLEVILNLKIMTS